jgi:hypothetical protein
LESSVLATLRLAEIKPVHGREFYDISALGVILDIVDHWPTVCARAIGQQPQVRSTRRALARVDGV